MEDVDAIITTVALETGVQRRFILGTSQAARYTKARYLLIHRLKQAGYPVNEIARIVNRHHSTVVYALQQDIAA